MTALIKARQLQIFIGSDLQDWSQTYESFTTNYASLGDKSDRGLVDITATLVLKPIIGAPESLDPRINPIRWRPGQTVYIQVRNDADTAWIDGWFSRLILLEEPSAPGLGNLSLELGCKLAWANLFELDDDQSGIALGTVETSDEVASRLLQASEVSASAISLATWPYSLAYGFGKTTRSFAGMAGELAYANDWRYLYQQPSGVITQGQLSFTPTSAISSFTIGIDDIRWEPLQDPQQPPELTKAAAAGFDVTTATNPSISTITVTGDFSDYATGASGNGTIQKTTITQSFNVGNPNSNPVLPPTKTNREEIETLEVLILQSPDIPTQLIDWQDKRIVRIYEAGKADSTTAKLLSILETREVRGKSIDPNDSFSNMRDVYRKTTEFTYDAAKEFISKIEITEEQAEIILDESSDNPWDFQITRTEESNWTEYASGRYDREEVIGEALITTNTNLDKSIQNIWALRQTSQLYFRNDPNTPPATEFFDAGVSQSEQHYEGTASFIHPGGSTGRNRQRLYTSEFGFSTAQMTGLAEKHRDLLHGRHRGHEIELAVNEAILTTPPLPEIHVTNGSDTFKYLGDALTLEFLPNQTTAYCVGIWIDGGYQPTVGLLETAAPGQDAILLELTAFGISETAAAGQDTITLTEVVALTLNETAAAGQDAITLTEFINLSLAETAAAGIDAITLTEVTPLTVTETSAAGTDIFTLTDLGATTQPTFSNVSLLLPMDSNFNDASNNGFTPTITGNATTTITESKWVGGGSGSFDGSGDYVEFAADVDFEFGTGLFTVCAWAKTSQGSGFQQIVGQFSASPLDGEWSLRHENQGGSGGGIGVAIRTSSSFLDLNSGFSINDNAWHFIRLVRESATVLRIYVDEILRGDFTISASQTIGRTGRVIRIGRNQHDGNADYNGYIDDLRITKGEALPGNEAPGAAHPTS